MVSYRFPDTSTLINSVHGQYRQSHTVNMLILLTLLHSERQKLHLQFLAFPSAIGLKL